MSGTILYVSPVMLDDSVNSRDCTYGSQGQQVPPSVICMHCLEGMVETCVCTHFARCFSLSLPNGGKVPL